MSKYKFLQSLNLRFTNNSSDSERLLLLSQLELDYSSIHESFSNITEIAAKLSGCKISLLNFVDQDTQWTVASYGMEVHQTPRSETICKFALEENKGDFEVVDLSTSEDFKNLHFIINNPGLNYYYSIPFYYKKRVALGTLCVMDEDSTPLSKEKKYLLKLLVKEIEERIVLLSKVSDLEEKVTQSEKVKNKLAHDIRGPLGGIIDLSEVVKSDGFNNSTEEMHEYFDAIHYSSSTIMELATDILSKNSNNSSTNKFKRIFDLHILQKKINQLYLPAALSKSIDFEVEVNELNSEVKFLKTKPLQILGNLVSNSIKYTPEFGRIRINLAISKEEDLNILQINIEDSGVGMNNKQIDAIGKRTSETTLGIDHETGFGLGLQYVQELIDQMNGEFHIKSELGTGTVIKISIPFT